MIKKKRLLIIVLIIVIVSVILIGMKLYRIFSIKENLSFGYINIASRYDKNFYNNYDSFINKVIDNYIKEDNIYEANSFLLKIFQYVANRNSIKYFEEDTEIIEIYMNIQDNLTQKLKNKFIELKYLEITKNVEENKVNDNYIPYNTLDLVFSNNEYSNNIENYYNIIIKKYDYFKKNESLKKGEYTRKELIEFKKHFSSINNYQESNNYLSEIENALKVEGLWNNKNYNNIFISISYFQKKVFWFDIKTCRGGFFDFQFTTSDTLTLKKSSIDSYWSPFGLNSILLGEESITVLQSYGTPNVEFVRVDINDEVYPYNIQTTYSESSIKEPKIGMTAEQVENSTWGSPSKVNKDTYSWGTTEQWVYNNKGYIYFKNGKVTSISER